MQLSKTQLKLTHLAYRSLKVSDPLAGTSGIPRSFQHALSSSLVAASTSSVVT